MNKIGLIVQREFNQRVRKRSFILTTLLMPLLMIGLMVAPALLMQIRSGDMQEILVVDHTGWIAAQLQSDSHLRLTPVQQTEEELRATDATTSYLIIGEDVMTHPNNIRLYTSEPLTMDVETQITSQIRQIVENKKLEAYHIADLSRIMDEVKTKITLQTFQIHETGEERASSSALSMGAAYIFGFMIYMFVLMYGVMVMQGVIEEKSSRILEILVCSVKPYELMMGKIVGIASVAIVQFLIWAVLVLILSTSVVPMLTGEALIQGSQGLSAIDPQAFSAIKQVADYGFLLKLFGGFLIYFIGGYLLYAAMFAAVGSAVDNIQDAQQLQLPVTIPLIFGIIIMMGVMQDPNSPLAVWCSIIPFTSPIIMMARIPYGVPLWQLVLSVGVLYASFIMMVWTAGKIYRVGIFMYGKKPSFQELYKWIKY